MIPLHNYINILNFVTLFIFKTAPLRFVNQIEQNEKKTNFIAAFCGWGSTASRLEPLHQGSSLVFTTKFSEIPGTHFINLRRMKG